MSSFFRLFRLGVVAPLARMAGRLDVTGRHHLPETGGFIVAGNHVSWMDPVWFGLAIADDRLHFMAKRELFAPPFGTLMRWCHSFPVDRRRPGPDTFRTASRLLADGQIVLMFPGGTRSAEAAALKRGAATLAGMAGVPLVPAQYRGPAGLRPGYLLNRPRVSVAFGAPIRLDDPDQGDSTRQRVQAATDRLAAAIDGLGERPAPAAALAEPLP